MSKKESCYKWTRKPRNAPDANIANKFIEGVKKKRGGITPQLLVIESKKIKSPLHDCFEWDDSKAAEGFRIVQAREILRFLVVVIEEDNQEESKTVRAYIAPSSIGKEDNTSYVTVGDVCEDEDLSAAYIRQLNRELIGIRNKIKNFKVFSEVVKAIDAVVLV